MLIWFLMSKEVSVMCLFSQNNKVFELRVLDCSQ